MGVLGGALDLASLLSKKVVELIMRFIGDSQ